MKIETLDLIGAPLDWAVAKAEGSRKSVGFGIDPFSNRWVYYFDSVQSGNIDYSPSTDWDDGKEIIIREKIVTYFEKNRGRWVAKMDFWTGYGPDPLVAAMRCFVQSVEGYEVEIPDELMTLKV